MLYGTYTVNLGGIRSVVTDGITLGHPCCAGDLDCKHLLPNNKAWYCVKHEYRSQQCAVMTCSNHITPGWKTCAEHDHRQCEAYYQMMGKAMFQLKSQLKRINVLQFQSSMPKGAGEKLLHENEGASLDNEGAGLDDEEIIVSGAGDIEAIPSTDALGATMSGQLDTACPANSRVAIRRFVPDLVVSAHTMKNYVCLLVV